MVNTLIVSAVGNKSKLIRKQILYEIYVNNVKMDCVFLIIPNLIRNCILGISFFKDEGCLINVAGGVVEFKGRGGEQKFSIPIVHMEVVEESEGDLIDKKINEKINNIICEDKEIREKLREILMKNKGLFRESPGRLECPNMNLK